MEDIYNLLLLKNQLCFPTYAAANKIIRSYQPMLKKLDLTYTQYIVMMVLWEKETVNEKDLVKALYLQANTLTPLLKKLLSKVLITIFKDRKDKRNIIISLTEKGMALKEKAICIPLSLMNEPFFTEEEAQLYKQLLSKILNAKEI